LCFKQEINQDSQLEHQNQEIWVEHENQERIDQFSQIKLENLKSCTQYKANVELRFNNEPVKDSTGQPLPSITTPEFRTKPDTSILPDLRIIIQTEDSADFELRG
jgi:hypothetical protein